MKDGLKEGLSRALKKVDLPGTKEEILRAATTLFSQKGMNGTTTREIASLAGVNIAALHYHWGGKEDLLQAVYQRMISELLAVTDRLFQEPAADLSESIIRHLGHLYDFFVDNPAYPRILLYGNLEAPAFLATLRKQYIIPVIKKASEWLRALMRLDEVKKINAEVALLSLYGLLLVPFADLAAQEEVLGGNISQPAIARKFKQRFLETVLTTFGLGRLPLSGERSGRRLTYQPSIGMMRDHESTDQ